MTPWVVHGGSWGYLVKTRVGGVLIGHVASDHRAPPKEQWKARDAETGADLGAFSRLRDAAAFLWQRYEEKPR